MDRTVLQVEWLRDEHAKLEVGGSSAGGREVREKLRDMQPCDSPVASLLVLIFAIFWAIFFVSWKPRRRHCRFSYASSKSSSIEGFEPTGMFKSIVKLILTIGR